MRSLRITNALFACIMFLVGTNAAAQEVSREGTPQGYGAFEVKWYPVAEAPTAPFVIGKYGLTPSINVEDRIDSYLQPSDEYRAFEVRFRAAPVDERWELVGSFLKERLLKKKNENELDSHSNNIADRLPGKRPDEKKGKLTWKWKF